MGNPSAEQPSDIAMTAVYPPGTTLTNAPPPYTVGVGANPVIVQPAPYIQPTYVQQQPTIITTQPTVVVAVTLKLTDHDHPYLEYCPRCQTTVTTRTAHAPGACWWTIFIVGCFFFWPIWYWLCCQSSKDVKHYCPNCSSLLAVKKRGC